MRLEVTKAHILAVTAALLFMAACAPSQEELMAGDHGDYPADYETIVKAFYSDHLHDPASAKFHRISVPITFYWGSRLSGFRYGWRVCVTLSSDNYRDPYPIKKTDALMIKNGHVIEFFPNARLDGLEMCADQKRSSLPGRPVKDQTIPALAGPGKLPVLGEFFPVSAA